MPALERSADDALAELRRKRLTSSVSAAEWLCARIDRAVSTDTVEYLDRAAHPESLKVRQIRWLHRQNLALRSYDRYLRLLAPSVADAVHARGGAPAKLLELGSGAGELTLALARRAAAQGMPVEITGSDIVPSYVRDANSRAKSQGVNARFRELSAFDLAGHLNPGDVDVAFVAQSIHHFTAGQVAKMIAQVGAIGARRFIGIDGHRSLLLCAALPALCAASFDRYFVHDAFVSMRRLYSEPELALIASIAAPHARVTVTTDHPYISMLLVDFAAPGVGR